MKSSNSAQYPGDQVLVFVCVLAVFVAAGVPLSIWLITSTTLNPISAFAAYVGAMLWLSYCGMKSAKHQATQDQVKNDLITKCEQIYQNGFDEGLEGKPDFDGLCRADRGTSIPSAVICTKVMFLRTDTRDPGTLSESTRLFLAWRDGRAAGRAERKRREPEQLELFFGSMS